MTAIDAFFRIRLCESFPQSVNAIRADLILMTSYDLPP